MKRRTRAQIRAEGEEATKRAREDTQKTLVNLFAGFRDLQLAIGTFSSLTAASRLLKQTETVTLTEYQWNIFWRAFVEKHFRAPAILGGAPYRMARLMALAFDHAKKQGWKLDGFWKRAYFVGSFLVRVAASRFAAVGHTMLDQELEFDHDTHDDVEYIGHFGVDFVYNLFHNEAPIGWFHFGNQDNNEQSLSTWVNRRVIQYDPDDDVFDVGDEEVPHYPEERDPLQWFSLEHRDAELTRGLIFNISGARPEFLNGGQTERVDLTWRTDRIGAVHRTSKLTCNDVLLERMPTADMRAIHLRRVAHVYRTTSPVVFVEVDDDGDVRPVMAMSCAAVVQFTSDGRRQATLFGFPHVFHLHNFFSFLIGGSGQRSSIDVFAGIRAPIPPGNDPLTKMRTPEGMPEPGPRPEARRRLETLVSILLDNTRAESTEEDAKVLAEQLVSPELDDMLVGDASWWAGGSNFDKNAHPVRYMAPV